MQIPHDNSGSKPAGSLILVSAPWPLFNRPSIQLGTLKSYVSGCLPDVRVETSHFYLHIAEAIGYEVYQAVSERTWLAESVYAAMLYPQRTPQIEKLFKKYAAGNPFLNGVSFTDLVAWVKNATDKKIAAMDWEKFDLAGFSSSLCQLTSTLYLLKVVKRTHPDLPTVVGGSNFSGDSAVAHLKMFPDIDYIVIGEGERPLRLLVERLCGSGPPKSFDAIEGLVERSALHSPGSGRSQLSDLKTLPPPVYDDYFQILNSYSPEKRFFATLPVEASRGCWWKQTPTKSGVRGCAFCNLNLQWEGYRRKESSQVVKEIDFLSSRHQLLSVAFMDNVLPESAAGDLFKQMKMLQKDFRLFSEIRASTPFNALKEMRSAGMAEVQVGIEALSTRLLKKMNKGISAIKNLEIMKNCEALGIKNDANLILYFPGSDETDVAETLSAMEYAMVFRPLKVVHFWLGLGSPIWQNHKAYHMRWVGNHPHYRRLFPEKIYNTCRFMVQAYRGNLGRQKKIWKPVQAKVREWKKVYAALHAEPFDSPILTYRDGGSFMMIFQKRRRNETVQHRIQGTSSAIYRFCQKPRSVQRILARFPGISEDRLLPFLRMMQDKRLVFEDQEKYLSLAVPVRQEGIIR